MPIIFIEPGILAVHTQVLDTASHQHALQQLTLPTGSAHLSTPTTDGIRSYRDTALVLKENVPHQLTMHSGWVILIEPTSQVGLQVSAMLAGRETRSLNIPHVPNEFSPLTTLLGLFNLRYQQQTHQYDPRISQLLKQLDQCLAGPCIKPDHWLAKDIAQQLNLSQSRFLHLFKENMGLPWRAYLLWRRLICAITALKAGHSATQAAYMAGFSDSAHLSRTFKKHFGITLQKLTALNNR
ncbi:AraC family transcriptional regulator [Pseudoalteromonas aurantia]|uniref:helix-turn-helix domain-containing protein n=1 Tax=Pseudoalteromonas aurantia TaxID=43654 RepID=UPI00110B9F25|nr:helix-turn-helix domain-containing protein [Pseudoalteromonas aurantia]TMO61752.1 AraC family transcriptional regulator [Pseudoalteromonas aurantia]